MRAGGVGALLMIALLIMEGQPENGGGTDFSGCLWGLGSLKSYLFNKAAWRAGCLGSWYAG